MATTGRRVQYRYLNRKTCGLGEDTLMVGIRQAMQQTRDGDVIGGPARARIADLDQSGQLTVLNKIDGLEIDQPAFSGQLILYRKGFDVPAIEEQLEEDKEDFNITQFQTDGKNKPIEGVLYFVVIGDHLGLIASSAVTGRWLERYLTWMLKDIGSVIEGESHVELNAQISVEGEASRAQGAKQISIHAASNSRSAEPAARRVKSAKGYAATVVEVLRTLGLGEDAIESVLESVPEGGSLEGVFQVFVKQGRRKVPLTSDSIDHMFRNFEEDALDVSGRQGKVSNGLLKLSEPVRVRVTESWLDPVDAIEQIMGTMYTWDKQGHIDLNGQQ